jgi:hypothetical protein
MIDCEKISCKSLCNICFCINKFLQVATLVKSVDVSPQWFYHVKTSLCRSLIWLCEWLLKVFAPCWTTHVVEHHDKTNDQIKLTPMRTNPNLANKTMTNFKHNVQGQLFGSTFNNTLRKFIIISILFVNMYLCIFQNEILVFQKSQ